MNIWDKIKYAILGDRPDPTTGLRPIEAALQKKDIEGIFYYLSKGSKQEDKQGNHILEKVGTDMETLKTLMADNIFPKKKEQIKKAFQKAMFHDLNSLTPTNIVLCRSNGVSLGISLPDGTTLFNQKGRSETQKQTWLQYARPEQVEQEFLLAADHNCIEDMKLLLTGNKLNGISPQKVSDKFLNAARKGHTQSLKLLYATKRVNIENTDEMGRTAVWHACHNGHLETASFLASQNADLSKSDSWGTRPFEKDERLSKDHKKVRQALLYQAIKNNNTIQIEQLAMCEANLMDPKLNEVIKTAEMREYIRTMEWKYRKNDLPPRVFDITPATPPNRRNGGR